MVVAHERWTVGRHGPPQEIADGVVTVVGEIAMPLGRFPRRMTVAALAGGRSAVFSAIALDEAGMERVEALGTPSFLIVPNAHHRLDAGIWKQRYPGLRVIAPAGARAGVEEVVPVDAVDDILDDPRASFRTVDGTGGGEGALLVKREDGVSLIVNDVIARIAHPQGLGAHLMARLFGFGVSAPQLPRPVRSKMVRDPSALGRQFREWAAIDGLRRIVPSHGEVIDQNPAAALETLARSLKA